MSAAMKNLVFKILPLLLTFTSAAVASPAAVDVLISDTGGRAVFRQKINGDDTFTTGKLLPGKYVVQLRADNLRGNRTIVLSAGSKKYRAESVAASQFGGAGVAMKVEVGNGLNIAGQIATVPVNVVTGGSRRAHEASVENMQAIQDRGGEGAMVIPNRH